MAKQSQPKTPRLFEVTVTQIEVTTRKAYVMALDAEDALRPDHSQDISMQKDDDTTFEISVSNPKEISRLEDVEPEWRDEEAYGSVGFLKYCDLDNDADSRFWPEMPIREVFGEPNEE